MDTSKSGIFIAKCRKKKNMTQKQLADCIGVSDKSVSKWERGINLPESSLFLPLCECLDIQVQELLLGEYIEKNELLNESNDLIIDLMKEKDQEAFLLYKFIAFFILLPILYMIFGLYVFPVFEDVIIGLSEIAPFTFMFGLLKAIECIIKHKSYFRYFLISSLSLFHIILYFLYIK